MQGREPDHRTLKTKFKTAKFKKYRRENKRRNKERYTPNEAMKMAMNKALSDAE